MLRNNAEQWGAIAKGFHWAMALLIVALILLGWSAVDYRNDHWPPASKAEYEQIRSLFLWHKSLGIVALFLLLARLAWRLVNPTPLMPQTLSPLTRTLALTLHALLYAIMLLMPLSGWVINSAADIPFRLFGVIPWPDLPWIGEAHEALAKGSHLALFWLLAAALALHILAALKHHFVDRDTILVRMLPGRDREEPSA